MTTPGDRERLALLVHEVRSPVAALAAIREAFPGEPPGGTGRRELVRLVVAACRGIERLVRDASMVSVVREPVDVPALLREVAGAAELRGAGVRLVIAPGAEKLEADPVRLRQALENLVANAIAQSDEPALALGARAEGGVLLLSVTDSGPGIPREDHERIFERGVRLGSAYPGAGLGLHVARSIAKAHGGHVLVDSRPGAGATFTLVFPLEDG